MVVALQPVVLGVIWYGLIVLTPVVLFWLALHVPDVIDEIRDRLATRRRAGQPQGPPIERLASDLRRLRTELVTQPPTTNVRRIALLSAYDSVLTATCARLDIDTELAVATNDRDRELERLRAEALIEQAGVPLQPAGP
jgi:hypothetical protein